MADIDWASLLGSAGNYLVGTGGTNQALGAANTGVNMANATVGNALSSAVNYATPYINLGTANMGAYQNALNSQGINQAANLGMMFGNGRQGSGYTGAITTQNATAPTTTYRQPPPNPHANMFEAQGLTQEQMNMLVSLYNAELGNPPNQDQAIYWGDRVKAGASLEQIQKEMNDSAIGMSFDPTGNLGTLSPYMKAEAITSGGTNGSTSSGAAGAGFSGGSGGLFSPYMAAGAEAAGQQMDAVNGLRNIGDMNSYQSQFAGQYAPYTGAGAEAAGQQLGAINDLKNIGDLNSYYSRTSGNYQPWIQAGTDAIPKAQAVAADIANGYGYGDFQNSGEYKALETANTQAQRALAAQAGASGMTGSGTMATALGNRMQENYANYFGQAQTADLNKNNSAAQIYQNFMSQGLTAQQAAYATAAQMQAGDINKAQGVITGLGNVANQGLNATNSMGQLASTTRGQDITRSTAEIQALGNIANQGINATNSGFTNALNLGNQQLAAQAQQINSLYNATNIGNQTAQQLMGNYMTGANIIGNNILQGAEAQSAAALRNSTTGNQALTSALSTLGTSGINSLLSSLGGAATTAGKAMMELLGLSGSSEPSDYWSNYDPNFNPTDSNLYQQTLTPEQQTYLAANQNTLANTNPFYDVYNFQEYPK